MEEENKKKRRRRKNYVTMYIYFNYFLFCFEIKQELNLLIFYIYKNNFEFITSCMKNIILTLKLKGSYFLFFIFLLINMKIEPLNFKYLQKILKQKKIQIHNLPHKMYWYCFCR